MKVALIGLDHPHSLLHLNSFHALNKIKEVYVWDDRKIKNEPIDIKKYFKICCISKDLKEIAGKKPFFVITALRHNLIKDICLYLIDQGIHILAEKPVGFNHKESNQIFNYLKNRTNKFGVCYINRADPRTKKTKEIIKEGICGKILTIEMRMLTTSVDNRDPSHWLFKKDYSGGGILNWLGCHFIDLMRYILDDEIVSVYADTEIYTSNTIDVEDACTLILRFKRGQIATLQLSYILTLSGSGYNNKSGYDTYISFNGDKGRIIWSSNEQPTGIYVESKDKKYNNNNKRNYYYSLDISEAYGGSIGENFINNYIQWCLDKEDPLSTICDAVKMSKIIESAYESAKTGQKILINSS
tara:strand:- start:112 stop:1179 length:1068 start_codon:yes stop_codon:yes gene_type:complete